MRLLIGKSEPARVITKAYGRGSLLGLLSLAFAFVMASRGMRGWQESAVRAMEDDAVEMARRGYRITSSGEYGWPVFGITYYKVTYERIDAPAGVAFAETCRRLTLRDLTDESDVL